MKNLKKYFLVLTILLSLPVWAQGLGPDFSCQGQDKYGEDFEVLINNFDFSKEISFKKKNKICNFQITDGSYNERSVAPQMILNFENRESCFISKKLKPLKKGFLKVILHKNFDEAYALILEGHRPVKCKIKEFNKNKLKTRINNTF
ncbi:MAG: hypothetical protein NDI69_00725 [Bacteriovoracaceae bacterium]|nr:hypothetical protein [Bacteriovoracaceae bacterium]